LLNYENLPAAGRPSWKPANQLATRRTQIAGSLNASTPRSTTTVNTGERQTPQLQHSAHRIQLRPPQARRGRTPLRQLNYIEVDDGQSVGLQSGARTPRENPSTPFRQPTPRAGQELYAIIDIERTAAMLQLPESTAAATTAHQENTTQQYRPDHVDPSSQNAHSSSHHKPLFRSLSLLDIKK
ncbi:hypothetical protein cypCar_00018197, partial [Cyprinus carpio]